MGIINILLIVISLTQLIIFTFIGGLSFLFSGLDKLMNYDPEFDEKKKKHSAILDVLGAALLLFFDGFFWFVIWPVAVAVAYYNLNLPTFS